MMKMTVSMISVGVLVVMLIMLPMWSEGQPGGKGEKGGRPPQGPPPEAIEACEDKSEGDVCEFTTPRDKTLSGTCRTVDDLLACAPEGGQHGGPPPNGSQGANSGQN